MNTAKQGKETVRLPKFDYRDAAVPAIQVSPSAGPSNRYHNGMTECFLAAGRKFLNSAPDIARDRND